jgi:hypothetical protein
LPNWFTSAIDGHITPWDNNAYAFLGEVTHDTATTICFPSTAFNPTPNPLIRTEEKILNINQNLDGMEWIPPDS